MVLDYQNSIHNFPSIARKSGFFFRINDDTNQLIDWRFIGKVKFILQLFNYIYQLNIIMKISIMCFFLIGTLDIDHIIRTKDFERLESAISRICEAPLGTILKNSILDPAVSKYFIAAQLCIQYYQFCVQYLEKNIQSLIDSKKTQDYEILKLRKNVRKKETEILQLLKRIHNKNVITSPCLKCAKSYDGINNLNTHLYRKPNTCSMENLSVTPIHHPVSDSNLINTIKLELDIKKLKERLNDTEKKMSNESICANREPDCKVNVQDFSCQVNFDSNTTSRTEINDKDNLENYKQFLDKLRLEELI